MKSSLPQISLKEALTLIALGTLAGVILLVCWFHFWVKPYDKVTDQHQYHFPRVVMVQPQ